MVTGSCNIITGQNRQYFTKALLIYDGIHYDPLVCHTGTGEVTTFTVDDEQVATLALNMAREAQQVNHHQYVRVDIYQGCILRDLGALALSRLVCPPTVLLSQYNIFQWPLHSYGETRYSGRLRMHNPHI